MSDTLAFAINRIQRRNKDGKLTIIPANSVFKTTRKQFGNLERINAVRAPTAEEEAVFRATKGNDAVVIGEDDESDVTGNREFPPSSGSAADPNGAPKKGDADSGPTQKVAETADDTGASKVSAKSKKKAAAADDLDI